MRKSIGFFAYACLAVSAATAHASSILCTVLAEAETAKTLEQDGQCDQRLTPASTFKVALSLMGYDAGYLTDEHLPALPFRDGYADWIPSWRTTTDPTAWIGNSVVWYSQRLTEWLGPERFRQYVTSFHYGNEDLSGNPGKHDGLTQAWLSSSLQITALEEAAFLEKLVRHELSVSMRAYDMTSRITRVAQLANGWDIHGKAGSGTPRRPDGTLDRDREIGWFVGWANKAGRTIVFVRCIEGAVQEQPRAGLRARADFLQELPALLDEL
jgi:beta-lactamase class D